MITKKILIIGSGSWGLALAQTLADNKQDVVVYGNNSQEIKELKDFGTNKKFFDSREIKSTGGTEIDYVDNLEIPFKQWNFIPDIILLAIPTNAVKQAVTSVKPYITSRVIFLNVAKGYTKENQSMSEVVREVFPDETKYPFVSLLGPSHAEEVIRRQLTFVNIVDPRLEVGYMIQKIFTNNYFKCSVIKDLETAELCSAMKNVIAFVSGIFTGLGYGDNARAALFSMGLSETYQLIKHKNPNMNVEFMLGLCGAGDLAVTCYSKHSRNFTAGEEIGELNSIIKYENKHKDNPKTVESLNTIDYLIDLVKSLENTNLDDFPILKFVGLIKWNVLSPSEGVQKIIIDEYNKIV